MSVVETVFDSVCNLQFWLLSFLAVILYYNTRYIRYKLPPRPRGWPIVGNMFAIDPPELHKWCMEQAKECGSDIIRITTGFMQDAIVVHNIKYATEALVDKGKDFSGRPTTILAFEVRTEGYQNVGFADTDQPNWSLRRKLLATSVRNFTNGRAFEDRTKLTFGRIQPLLDAQADSGEPFNPEWICKLYITNHMAGICFSKTFKLEDKDFIQIIEDQERSAELVGEFNISDLFPFLKKLPFPMPDRIRAEKAMQFFADFCRDEIKRHKETFTGEEQNDLTYHVLKLMSGDGAYSVITDVEQRQLLMDIFSAGIDTSQMQLRWILNVLAAYPHVQDRLYQEIVDITGTIDRDDPDFGVSAIDYRSSIPFVDAVILESTRFGTVAPLGLPHKTMCDSTIGGYDIPKGWQVMFNQYAINHDDRGNEKPYEFRPERFLKEDGRLGPRPVSYLPFGAGRRSCPGETASRTTLWMTLVMLLRRYQILPPEGENCTVSYARKSPLFGEPKDFRIRLNYRH